MSPSQIAVWSSPMPKSSRLRQSESQLARAPLAAARSAKSTMPAPKSIEKMPIIFWSMKISPKTAMAQSSPVSVPAEEMLK